MGVVTPLLKGVFGRGGRGLSGCTEEWWSEVELICSKMLRLEATDKDSGEFVLLFWARASLAEDLISASA